MATRTLMIPGPFYSANANAFPETYSNVNSGTTQDFECIQLVDATTATLSFLFWIPAEYVDTPKLVVWWTAETTGGDVDWQAVHRIHTTPGTTLVDTDTTPANVTDSTLNDTGVTAASQFMESEITIANGDITAGKMWYCEFSRLGSADALNADVSLLGLGFRYNDA
jgi:hypothetical protein